MTEKERLAAIAEIADRIAEFADRLGLAGLDDRAATIKLLAVRPLDNLRENQARIERDRKEPIE